MTVNHSPKSRGIYLLPNLFTIGALFAGFYAIIASFAFSFENAAIALLVALILDGLDGRVARLTGTQTEFGAQLDSLSDMVCFGMTPALLLYNWSLSALGKLGWLVAFIYTMCTALRLARFNSQSQNENKRYFQGLATPAAATWVATFVWLLTKYGIDGEDLSYIILVVAIVLSLLKVSTIRFRSFKDINIEGRVSFMMILTLMFVLVLISFNPPAVLCMGMTLYILAGPVETLWVAHRRRKQKK